MARSTDQLYDFANVQKEIRALLKPVQDEIHTVKSSVESIQNTAITTPVTYSEIVNILNNSHPEWSTAAYDATGVTPSDPGDSNYEAKNWYRVLGTETNLTQTSATALKADGHSLWAANEAVDLDIPRWDRPNGQIELGGEADKWDLVYKLPTNLVFPGMYFYIQFEAMLRTSDPVTANLQASVEYWDNTAGQRRTIEGGNFTITGEIYGDQSGSETVEYQVVAKTDSGEEAISNILSFANAPAVFTQNNHPRINVRGAPGFTQFDIYRHFDGEYVLQFVLRNSIDSTYFDTGNTPVRVVSGFPSLTATPPKALATTRTFIPGSINGTGFVRHSLVILVPTTYDRTNTDPDMQWLRIRLTQLTDVPRQIVIRRIGVSQGDGQWARSANDLRQGAHSTPTSTPVSSGSGGSGGGVLNPDEPGSGTCVLLECTCDIYGIDGQVESPSLIELEALVQQREVYAESSGVIGGKVLRIKRGWVSKILRITCENGVKLPCTFDHPIITSFRDIYGTAASKLKVGDLMQTRKGLSVIVDIKTEFGQFEVGIPILEGSHICVLNGVFSHNEKPEPGSQS